MRVISESGALSQHALDSESGRVLGRTSACVSVQFRLEGTPVTDLRFPLQVSSLKR